MYPDIRYTWACAHVYCEPCHTKAALKAKHPSNLFQYCYKCGGVIIRPDNAYPCNHAVRCEKFRPEQVMPGEEVFPSRERLIVSQAMGHECQKCSVMAHLRALTHQMRSEICVLPFAGEVFACLEVNGHVLHGMMNEFPETQVDLVDDAVIKQPKYRIEDMVSEIAGTMSKYPWEANFTPIGDMKLTFRARGWFSWAAENPEEAKKVRVKILPQELLPTQDELEYRAYHEFIFGAYPYQSLAD
jgi:hypothetical protein